MASYTISKKFLGENSTLKKLFLKEYHDLPIGGHAGILKKIKHIQQNVYWEGIRKDVTDYVSSCLTYQQTKYVLKAPLGLLQPITSAGVIWEDMALVFIVSSLAYHGQTVIIVVSDRFSKVAHFGTLPHNFSACEATQLFTNLICELHCYSRSIISYRYPYFWAIFGNHYSSWIEQNLGWASRIILKQTNR